MTFFFFLRTDSESTIPSVFSFLCFFLFFPQIYPKVIKQLLLAILRKMLIFFG